MLDDGVIVTLLIGVFLRMLCGGRLRDGSFRASKGFRRRGFRFYGFGCSV